GKPEILETDPRFADLGSRTRHIDELYQLVGEILATRTTAEWLKALDDADIPVMPMHTVESILEDPHMKAIDFFEIVEHPSEGRIRSMAVPGTWSASQPKVTRLAPRLGEHTREILAEAGLTDAEVSSLIADKATLAT